jgi:hypothetical protein
MKKSAIIAYAVGFRPAPPPHSLHCTVGVKGLNFHLYSKGEFFKSLSFKGTIRIFLNRSAVYIGGLRPYVYLTYFFRGRNFDLRYART